jgi:hypothetical protein
MARRGRAYGPHCGATPGPIPRAREICRDATPTNRWSGVAQRTPTTQSSFELRRRGQPPQISDLWDHAGIPKAGDGSSPRIIVTTPHHRKIQVKRSIFGLALASFALMTVSLSLAADLAGSPERVYLSKRSYISTDNVGCSCDAPGIVGLVCATPRTCEEISGLCKGRC